MYLQQYLTTGVYVTMASPALDEWVDVFTSIMDGPQFYYRRMQLAPPTTTQMPYMGADIVITINFIYIMCGNIPEAIRSDFNLTAASEWTGGTDGVDNNVPTFGWNELYGYAKRGGLAPKPQRIRS